METKKIARQSLAVGYNADNVAQMKEVMIMTDLRQLLVTGVVVLTAGATLQADPIWPDDLDWTPVLVSGIPYIDALDSPDDVYAASTSPDQMNLVGGLDGNSAVLFPTAFFYADNDNLMFRMRVDGNPTGANSAWIVFLNTDLDTEVDWVLSLDSSGDNQVELVPALSGGPAQGSPWNPVVIGPTPHTGVSPLAIWSRFVDATAVDGSEFDGDTDYFVDIAYPLSDFLSTTGLSASDPFGLAFATSSDHNNINKDLPDFAEWGQPPNGGVIPEPTSILLLLGSVPLFMIRKHRAA